jgi:hypothetical protein
MRGDQLARQWRVIRAIEASPNGLTMAEISDPMGHLEPNGREALKKPVPKAGMGFFAMGC